MKHRQTFTPPALLSLAKPPAFTLRPPHRNEWSKYVDQLRAAGIRFHPKARLRAEALVALRTLWPAARFETESVRLKALWQAIDAGQDIADDDRFALDDLTARLTAAWPPLSDLAADNLRYEREPSRTALSRLLVGWRGVPLKLVRTPHIPDHLLASLEAWMAEAETAAPVASLRRGTAFEQLLRQAVIAIGTTSEPFSSSAPGSRKP